MPHPVHVGYTAGLFYHPISTAIAIVDQVSYAFYDRCWVCMAQILACRASLSAVHNIGNDNDI